MIGIKKPLTIQPLVTSFGSQINEVAQWGAQSDMNVDPVDECTFWYANEYLQTTGSLNWSTFIINFKLAAVLKTAIIPFYCRNSRVFQREFLHSCEATD